MFVLTPARAAIKNALSGGPETTGMETPVRALAAVLSALRNLSLRRLYERAQRPGRQPFPVGGIREKRHLLSAWTETDASLGFCLRGPLHAWLFTRDTATPQSQLTVLLRFVTFRHDTDGRSIRTDAACNNLNRTGLSRLPCPCHRACEAGDRGCFVA